MRCYWKYKSDNASEWVQRAAEWLAGREKGVAR